MDYGKKYTLRILMFFGFLIFLYLLAVIHALFNIFFIMGEKEKNENIKLLI